MAELTFEVDEKTLNALASDPNTLRRCFNSFIERLIRHVLWAKKKEVLLPLFEESSSFVVPLYTEAMGNVICLLLSLIDQDISQLFEGIKAHIKMKDNLKAFISRLAENLIGISPQHLLFFISIVVRIFTKTDEDPYYTMTKYVETVSEVLEENKARIVAAGGFESMDRLVSEILKNPVSLNEFRRMKCGKASDYF